MKYLVTGGAGFIGSHIVDALLRRNQKVIIYDNFSTGKKSFIQHNLKNSNCKLVEGDILDYKLLLRLVKNVDFVFHFAAHADVRSGYRNHQIDHQQNLEMTRLVLEAMHESNVKKLAFASTSSVYGDAKVHPTPEDYPFQPTSLYGATKAACESYIYTYANYYHWQTFIFRFVSFIGKRYQHGIIIDLLRQIQSKPKILKLLSDGTPKKSSLYVKDGISAIFKVLEKAKECVNIYNIGHDEILTVDQIVDLIMQSVKCKLPKEYSGGDRGWKGDNNFVHLDTSKLKDLGWSPKKSMYEAIDLTVKYLMSNPKILNTK